jgi:hypothetical protein
VNVAEISNEKGEVLARSTGTFVAVDMSRMFARQTVISKYLNSGAKILTTPNFSP